MMKVRFYLALALLPAILGSCTTDFDVNAEWKDITVVYGLLNQSDSVTYLKINKAFLGEGNALQYAQVPDSSSYGNALEVKVEEYSDNTLTNTFLFDTTTIYTKDSGTFYYPNQVVYRYNTMNKLKEDKLYKLVITNTRTGKVIKSETPLVHDFEVNKPSGGQKTIDFTSSLPGQVEWVSGQYGKRYQVIIRFHYKEINTNTPSDTTFTFVDWLVGSRSSSYLTGGEIMNMEYQNEGFYTFLKSKLPANPDIKRFEDKINGIDFVFSVAGDEFNTYLELNEPSNSIIQERPEYTNIENGIGIFASRYTKKRKNLMLNPASFLKLQDLGIGF